jgi:hypothetical protein
LCINCAMEGVFKKERIMKFADRRHERSGSEKDVLSWTNSKLTNKKITIIGRNRTDLPFQMYRLPVLVCDQSTIRPPYKTNSRYSYNAMPYQHAALSFCSVGFRVKFCNSKIPITKFKNYLNIFEVKFVGRDSSVGIATRYRLDGPGIESRLERDFLHQSRPDLGPTQPPIQWLPGPFQV